MKHEAPTEREIADLFAPAYEKWAEPDARRLAAIEQRLLQRPRRRVGGAWRWLFAALATGAASALWWAVDYDSDDGRKAPKSAVISPAQAPSTANQPARPSQSEGAESKSAGEPGQKRSPVIFQRER